jgi:hypothetical protein
MDIAHVLTRRTIGQPDDAAVVSRGTARRDHGQASERLIGARRTGGAR